MTGPGAEGPGFPILPNEEMPEILRPKKKARKRPSGTVTGGVLGVVNEVFAPTQQQAQAELDRQTILPAPAPTPGDKPPSIYEGKIVIELGAATSGAEVDAETAGPVASAPETIAGNVVIEGDNLTALGTLPDESFTLVYIDPPFNTGREQRRHETTSVRVEEGAGGTTGFKGRSYDRIRGDLKRYDDAFDDYWAFLEPRIVEAWRLLADDGTLYLHLDYREAHYAKVMLDAIFGRDSFLNEIIWAYDYGAKSKSRWPTKHDTILVYVKNPKGYYFDSGAVDREPYMAPGLVTPEKVERGKLPTDVWWHTIVSPTGKEKTGYPTQKPMGILRRIVQASSREGDLVLDFFAGSGTTGAVAAELGRRFVLIDQNPEAIAVMRKRFAELEVSWRAEDEQG